MRSTGYTLVRLDLDPSADVSAQSLLSSTPFKRLARRERTSTSPPEDAPVDLGLTQVQCAPFNWEERCVLVACHSSDPPLINIAHTVCTATMMQARAA